MRLGDLIDLVRGNTYKSKLLSETDGPVLLGLGSIARNGGFKYGAWKHYLGESDSRILLYPGDLYASLKDLTQECDLLGAVARVPVDLSEGRLTQDTVKLVFDSEATELDKQYVYWSLRTPQYRAYCKGRGTGTTNMSLSRADFLAWKLPTRSAFNDSLIAIFEIIEQLIRLNQKTNDYLTQAMESLYHKYFSYDDQPYGSIYDIADVVYGAPFSSKLFNETGEGWPLIRIRDLSTFAPQYFTKEEHPKRTFIESGDVVAGMDAEFTPTLWLGERAVLNQRVCEFVPPAGSAITKSYLLCATKPLLAYVQNYAAGTTVAHLGKGDLEALNVPLPREEDLIAFGAVAEPMRLSIVANAKESARLAALRDTLLPKLMSEEICVSQIEYRTQPNDQ